MLPLASVLGAWLWKTSAARFLEVALRCEKNDALGTFMLPSSAFLANMVAEI